MVATLIFCFWFLLSNDTLAAAGADSVVLLNTVEARPPPYMGKFRCWVQHRQWWTRWHVRISLNGTILCGGATEAGGCQAELATCCGSMAKIQKMRSRRNPSRTTAGRTALERSRRFAPGGGTPRTYKYRRERRCLASQSCGPPQWPHTASCDFDWIF